MHRLYMHSHHGFAPWAGEMEALQEAIGTGSLDQAEMLGRLISRVAALEAAAAESAAQRRALHNQLVELRGNVRRASRLPCRQLLSPAVLCCAPLRSARLAGRPLSSVHA